MPATTNPSIFPLRWESTGDQWWFASPVDLAAATGRYDLLRALLHGDPNLLIQLTSLRRLRRLESVWDDDPRFSSASRHRSNVARALLLDGGGELLRAGYGGWLLYTAASGGDFAFAEELLQADPLLAFGEGEFGVTDVLYAAARGGSPDLFRMVYVTAAARIGDVLRLELRNRAAHAAARGGCLEVLKELLEGPGDVLRLRDAKGSTVLHAAAGKGQSEVVKYLIASLDVVDSRDEHGNTALHVAAFRGYLSVAETLLNALPESAYATNETGDTFVHAAVSGFKAPGFHWLERQMQLVRSIISGRILDIDNVINLTNNDGRTVLHMAVGENAHPDLVSLLMSIKSIDLNIRDARGMTPLDLLGQCPQSTSSEMLIKQLISGDGMPNLTDNMTRSIIASQMKMRSLCNSPGTSFKLSDAEIFPGASAKSHTYMSFEEEKELCERNSLKSLLQWPREENVGILHLEDNDSGHSSGSVRGRMSLRQRFSKEMSLPTHKRKLSIRSDSMPSPSTRKRFTSRLTHGVIQTIPQMLLLLRSFSSSSSRMSAVPHSPFRQTHTSFETENNPKKKSKYFCFGSGHPVATCSSNRSQLRDFFKDSPLSAS